MLMKYSGFIVHWQLSSVTVAFVLCPHTLYVYAMNFHDWAFSNLVSCRHVHSSSAASLFMIFWFTRSPGLRDTEEVNKISFSQSLCGL